jgi:hypothetical protein
MDNGANYSSIEEVTDRLQCQVNFGHGARVETCADAGRTGCSVEIIF